MTEREVTITSMRPAYGDMQKATVELEEEKVDSLLKEKTIKIGWISCRVTERMQIDRCYRCMEHGHTAPNCRKEDRKNNCRKCGKKAHFKGE